MAVSGATLMVTSSSRSNGCPCSNGKRYPTRLMWLPLSGHTIPPAAIEARRRRSGRTGARTRSRTTGARAGFPPCGNVPRASLRKDTGRVSGTRVRVEEEFGIDQQRMSDSRLVSVECQRTWSTEQDERAVLCRCHAQNPLRIIDGVLQSGERLDSDPSDGARPQSRPIPNASLPPACDVLHAPVRQDVAERQGRALNGTACHV